jgi:hypothetical protein
VFLSVNSAWGCMVNSLNRRTDHKWKPNQLVHSYPAACSRGMSKIRMMLTDRTVPLAEDNSALPVR